MKNFSLSFEIMKVGEDEDRLVCGEVYAPDVVDAQGDSASAQEIEKACHRYAKERRIGLMHKAEAGDKVDLVECYIARVPMQIGNKIIKVGTWMIVVKINDDEIWRKVKSGEWTGFSMGGRARAG